MKKTPRTTVPGQIGKTLAYVQDTFDVAFSWGFRKLKSTKMSVEDTSPARSKAKKAANKIFTFFGELGDSFYSEYEKIKQERSKTSKK